MHHTEGIILDYYNIGEADRMIVLYTKDFGMLKIFARSIRLSKSKLSRHTTIFSKARISFVHGRELLRLTDAEEISLPVWHPQKFNVASKISRLVTRLVHGQEQDASLWRLLDSAFLFLKNSDTISYEFEILFGVRLLYCLGYVGDVPKEIDQVLNGEEWHHDPENIIRSLLPIFQKGIRVSQL